MSGRNLLSEISSRKVYSKQGAFVTGQTITTTPPPEPLDLVGIWRSLMIIIPVVTGVILLILGIVMFRSNEQSR